jgi:hypothetical protein
MFNIKPIKLDRKEKTRALRKMVVEKVGIVDLDGLYKTMRRWFYDYKYYFEEPTTRIRPGSAAGVEYEWIWKGWKKPNEYMKQNLDVYFYIWDVKDIEVVKDGEKVKLTKCRILIEFDGDIELDYGGFFEKTWWSRILFNLYNSLVLQEEKQVANWWDELYYHLYKLQTITKEYLDMEAKGNAYYDVW